MTNPSECWAQAQTRNPNQHLSFQALTSSSPERGEVGKHGLQGTEDVKKGGCLHLRPALVRRQPQFEEKEGREVGFTMLSCRGEAIPWFLGVHVNLMML